MDRSYFLPFRCGDDTHCPRPLGEERCLWDCCYNNLGNIVCDDDAKACFLALWDTLSIAVRAQHKRTSNGSAVPIFGDLPELGSGFTPILSSLMTDTDMPKKFDLKKDTSSHLGKLVTIIN